MGNVKRQKRVASFDTIKVNGKRTFKPVNKRAKAYASAYKVKALSLSQVREVRELGKHRVVVYDNPLSSHFLAVKV